MAVGERVELRLPRLSGIAQPGDEKDIRSLLVALDPELDLAGRHALTHPNLPARLRPTAASCQRGPQSRAAPRDAWSTPRHGTKRGIATPDLGLRFAS
jgi:hypothetical protein